MNVCTHAGLNSNEKRLLTPDKAFTKVEPRYGEGLREPEEEGGESGGAGRRDLGRILWDLARPDSSTYGVSDDRRRPILRAISSFSSSSISTSFISSLTP